MDVNLITDIVSGINLFLVVSSVILVLAIVTMLGLKESYILAKGWRFFLPAILVMGAIRVYDFFIQYGVLSRADLIRESMFLVFNFCLFFGLFIQFLAIRQTIEKRQ